MSTITSTTFRSTLAEVAVQAKALLHEAVLRFGHEPPVLLESFEPLRWTPVPD